MGIKLATLLCVYGITYSKEGAQGLLLSLQQLHWEIKDKYCAHSPGTELAPQVCRVPPQRALCLVSCSAVTILAHFIIYEPQALHFNFAMSSANYFVGHGHVTLVLLGCVGLSSPPITRRQYVHSLFK